VGRRIGNLTNPCPGERGDQCGIADLRPLVAARSQDQSNLLDGVAENLAHLRFLGLETDPGSRVYRNLLGLESGSEDSLDPGQDILHALMSDLSGVGLLQEHSLKGGEILRRHPVSVVVPEMFGEPCHVAAFGAARTLVGVL
jgi:hypothetical protein